MVHGSSPCGPTNLKTQPLSVGFFSACRASMDGKGCWRGNVFFERLWRSVKYKEVYLYAYDSMSQAKAGLAKYFALYNTRRPHSSFDGIPPEQAYFGNLPTIRIAA